MQLILDCKKMAGKPDSLLCKAREKGRQSITLKNCVSDCEHLKIARRD